MKDGKISRNITNVKKPGKEVVTDSFRFHLTTDSHQIA